MKEVKITKEMFDSYRALQKSGVVNMIDVKNALFWLKNANRIQNMTDEWENIIPLTEDEYKEILFNYGEYREKYDKTN